MASKAAGMDEIGGRLTAYGLYRSENDLGHHSYLLERRILEAFRDGDPAPLLAVIDDFSSIQPGIMSRSAFKQSEYMAVLIISMVVREAMEAGLNQDQAYAINDLYLQELSEANSTSEHQRIMRSAVLELHELLLDTQRGPSPYVEKCKSFIASHLHKPFTLEELALHVGLTPTYLSAHFSHAEHITIREYTLRQRVMAAQHMLKFSDYPISLIAEYLCFCSQSYFTTVFKHRTGRTPLNYRKQFHR